ncbi:hypothetical protein RQP46_005094 [Phenoliferia psychrophenolica]
MAIRMAIDLGLHKPFMYPEDLVLQSLRSHIFWSVVVLDRIVSCATGRPTSIPLDQIEVDLPPSRPISTPDGRPLTDPFPWLCRILCLLGSISNTINAASPTTLLTPSLIHDILLPFRQALAIFDAELPVGLHFSIHSLQAYSKANYSQCFLLLSVWHQAVHLALYENGLFLTDLLEREESFNTQSSAISITDMICFTNLVAPNAFLSVPIFSQALLMGGRVASRQLESCDATTPAVKVDALRRSLGLARSTLSRMEGYWRGLSWNCRALEAISEQGFAADFVAGNGAVRTSDRGMVARARLEDMSLAWINHINASDFMLPKAGELEAAGGGGDISLWDVIEEPSEATLEFMMSGGPFPPTVASVNARLEFKYRINTEPLCKA